MNFIRSRSTHSQRLEVWAGKENVERVSAANIGWYGRPIATNLPGAVYVCGDGDYIGQIARGSECSAEERLREIHRAQRNARLAWAIRMVRPVRSLHRQAGTVALADVVAKRWAQGQVLHHRKTSTYGGVTGACFTSWRVAGSPDAGATPSAAPGGNAPTKATAGAMWFNNPDSGQVQRVLYGRFMQETGAPTGLLYDRIFHVLKTMSSSATEAVTGVPTRYQSTTQGAEDSAENNFLFPECSSALGATAHNWTVCTYTDQSGNAGITLPSVTGISSCAQDRLDMPLNQWFCPLDTGDTGIQKLTQMQCSAVVTGGINFIMGHPICWLLSSQVGEVTMTDGLLSAFDLERIFDDACLSMLSVIHVSASSPRPRTQIRTVSLTP